MTLAKRNSAFHNAIDDIKEAHYETERYVEELEEENEKLLEMLKVLNEVFDVKATLEAFNTPINQAIGEKVFGYFIANHKKGENNEQ